MSTQENIKRVFRRIFKRHKKVGLALGGGNSRGFAHVGILKAFVENGIPIDLIAGTSSGAVFGGLFAAGMDIDKMVEESKKIDWFKIIRFRFNGLWPISGEGLEELIRKYVGDVNIEDLAIPFAAVSSDYKSGDKVILRKGSLAKAVHASSAIPGAFAPVEIDHKLLMDGLMIDNVPIDVAHEMGADYIIAVDPVPLVVLTEGPKNVRQIVERAIDISSRHQAKCFYKYADIIINPVKENISPLDMNRAAQLINIGEQAAKKVVAKIKDDLCIS